MRSIAPTALGALVVLSMLTMVHPAAAKAPLQPAPTTKSAPAEASRKVSEYLVKNQNGLVTVQEKDGPFIFAQVMSTSKLKIDISDGGKMGVLRITLRDEKNIKLWETKMGDGNAANFGFNWTYGDDKTSGVVHLSVTPREAVETGEDAQNPKGTILVGADGLPYRADIRADEGGIHMERKGDSFVLSRYEDGKLVDAGTINIDAARKTVSALVDGKTLSVTGSENSITLNGAGQTVKVTTVTKDGKNYTRIDIGDQHILLDGYGYKVNTDGGEIVVAPDPASK